MQSSEDTHGLVEGRVAGAPYLNGSFGSVQAGCLCSRGLGGRADDSPRARSRLVQAGLVWLTGVPIPVASGSPGYS
jgi:hypothetical protein